jgi:hypothetical protein
MFVRWSRCHALHRCTWNGVELRTIWYEVEYSLQIIYIFLECGICVVQVDGSVNDDVA